MKLLLDTGIYSHSEFITPVVIREQIEWGGIKQSVPMERLQSKPASKNPVSELNRIALLTIGRLIREKKITAYTYSEIRSELWRGRARNRTLYALSECEIVNCPAPLERSKVRVTGDIIEANSKGGKSDRKNGRPESDFNQIAFFKLLNALDKTQTNALKKALLSEFADGTPYLLTAFEAESLDNLSWFQHLCQRAGSEENYPDVFHLWTAERNGLDGVLTLDEKMQRLVHRVKGEKKPKIKINTNVLLPLDVLEKLSVSPDPFPIEPGRVYSYLEMFSGNKN